MSTIVIDLGIHTRLNIQVVYMFSRIGDMMAKQKNVDRNPRDPFADLLEEEREEVARSSYVDEISTILGLPLADITVAELVLREEENYKKLVSMFCTVPGSCHNDAI